MELSCWHSALLPLMGAQAGEAAVSGDAAHKQSKGAINPV